MQITNTSQTNMYTGFSRAVSAKRNPVFQTEKVNTDGKQTSEEGVIAYYNELAREFPDVAFKVSDSNRFSVSGTDEPIIGYKGNSYQTSSAFGMPGKCSIEIDFCVLEKMIQDVDFAEQIKAEITLTQNSYKMYGQWLKRDGYEYGFRFIRMEGGQLAKGFAECHCQPSSDDEIRKMRQKTGGDERKIRLDHPAVTQTSSEEIFMEMLDETHRRQRLQNRERRKEEWQDNQWKRRMAEEHYSFL